LARTLRPERCIFLTAPYGTSCCAMDRRRHVGQTDRYLLTLAAAVVKPPDMPAVPVSSLPRIKADMSYSKYLAGLALLPDRSYVLPEGDPYKFLDVTALVGYP